MPGIAYPGLTKREHAALVMRVPMSGDPDLDAIILAGLRVEIAKAAMSGMLAQVDSDTSPHSWDGAQRLLAERALECTDALLAALFPKEPSA